MRERPEAEVYSGRFLAGRGDIIRRFALDPRETAELERSRIVLAHYDNDGYHGAALVVFIDAHGYLREVNASHCSCNDLATQWSPQETSWEALGMWEHPGEYDSVLTRLIQWYRGELEYLRQRREYHGRIDSLLQPRET